MMTGSFANIVRAHWPGVNSLGCRSMPQPFCSNARARAYIERARSAVAERQRVAEAASAAADADPRREWRGDGAKRQTP